MTGGDEISFGVKRSFGGHHPDFFRDGIVRMMGAGMYTVKPGHISDRALLYD